MVLLLELIIVFVVFVKKEYIGDKRSTDGENVQQGFISEVSLSDD
jgi:hypothetical protein